MRPVPAVLLGVLAVLSAGCAQPGEGGPAAQTGSGISEDAAASSSFESTYSGLLLYRLAGDSPPQSMESGDPHEFCFTVPPGTDRLDVRLDWSPAKPFALELGYPGGGWMSYSVPSDLTDLPPIEVSFEAPADGKWSAYVGPYASDAATEWTLTLGFVGAEGASVAETKAC